MADDWLKEGTQAHYRDAAYYDQRYRHRRSDVRYYARLAAELRGPVLELGAGTGRITLAIAEAGSEITGVESMPAMLTRARDRLAKRPRKVQARVSLQQGDLRTLRLGQRFPVVIAPFNVLMHMYERSDLEAALATVRDHLTPDGLFAFDILVPDPRALGRDPYRLYKMRPVKLPGKEGHYEYREAFRYEPMSQVQQVSIVLESQRDPSDVRVQTLCHRQYFPQEIAALLHYNGFTVTRHEGDFDGGPLTDTSESQLVHARLREPFDK